MAATTSATKRTAASTWDGGSFSSYLGDPRVAASGGRGAKRMRVEPPAELDQEYLSDKGPNKALQDMLGLQEQKQGDVYDLYCD